METLDLVWLVPALPLAGFLVLLVFGRRLGEPAAGWVATAACGAAFITTVVLFVALLGEDEHDRVHVYDLFDWIHVGGFRVNAGFLLDPLSVTMALFITGIGTLIHLYSIAYMHGDEKFSKFFVYLNLFVFSMLMLVLGSNLLITFLGWEGVGACSYFLIAFWFSKDANASAGKKAFVTNRIGDWGFMTAMFLAFATVGSLDYSVVLERAPEIAPVTATAIALLLFVGACGKSAQLPLFVWLPDAMAGPTPVSALIHAATMVTAGVYLMTRVNPIIAASFTWTPDVIAWVGVITALFAATIAIAQTDIKKVLAYSTVSQLGFMFLAIGSGAYVAAVFHMITHAFFKGLLFLGSGSVIHGMHGEQDMRRMGGLRKVMPITAVTFIIGWLAIAGVPPFAGFWSKDEILLFAYEKNPALWFIALVTALITAYYMTRQVIMVFYGEPRWREADADHEALEPHESPWMMTAPLVVLAVLSMLGGAQNLPFTDSMHRLEIWLEPVLHGNEAPLTIAGGGQATLALIAAATSMVGIVLGVRVYLQKRIAPIEPEILAEGWHYDAAITAFMGGPGEQAFEGVAAFDRTIVDGAVNGVAASMRGGGRGLRLLQTGYVRSYALGVAVGVVALLSYFLAGRDLVPLALVASEASHLVTTSPLTAAVVVPFIGAVVVALIPRGRVELHRLVALLFATGTGAVTLWLLAAFDGGDAGFQFEVNRTWISEFGISWHLGIDGISLFLVVLSGLLFPLAIVAVAPHHDPKPYYAWLLVLQGGCIGVFCALDLFVFFVMFEIVLVPMYFLIGGWGYGERVYAALKFFLFTMFGSAFMLVGIVALALLHQDGVALDNEAAAVASEQAAAEAEQQAADAGDIDAATQALIDENVARAEELRNPPLDFDMVEIAESQHLEDTSTSGNPFDWSAVRWIFLAFAIAFAVKVPLVPLHTWLPDAHTQAPTAGSVILAGVMLKLGTYGFVRCGLYLLPEASVWFAPTLVALGVVGIIYGAVVATMQRDLKRLVAYSSVAHLGFIVLGTFALTTQSIQGGIVQMVNHGISTGALFLLVGMIYERRHTREISALMGLQKVAPIMAGVFTVVMLSSIGLPGLNGFVGEFLVLVGSFLTRRWATVIAATGVILAALYLLWAYQRVFHGEPDAENADMPDMSWREGLVMAPLLALIVFLGVYPKPMLDRIEPAVGRLVAHIEVHSDYVEPEVAATGAVEGSDDEEHEESSP